MSTSDPSFEFKSPCGHTYQVPAVMCTAGTGPGCNCGKPWMYLVDDIQCPVCKYKPKFVERPLWTHIGVGFCNPKGILNLEIHREEPPERVSPGGFRP